VTTNPVSERLSTKSTTDPFSNRQLALSRNMRNSECFQMISVTPGSEARSNSTASPEHPPGRTLSLNPELGPVAHRIMRRINFSAAGVNSMVNRSVSFIPTATKRGTFWLIKLR
jgi:hypothetical protein